MSLTRVLVLLLSLLLGTTLAYDEFFDDDENQQESVVKDVPRAARATTTVQVPVDMSYTMEIGFILITVLFVINYFYGKSVNRNRADLFVSNVLPTLREHFAKVGLNTEQENQVVVKESDTLYKIYASGRNNCMGIVLTLSLSPRQDLFSTVMSLVTDSRDTLTIEIPKKKMKPFIFILCERSNRSRFGKENEDVKALCKEVDTDSKLNRSSKYSVLTDCQSTVKCFMSNSMCKRLNTIGQQLRFLYFTDRAGERFPPNDPLISKRYLHFEFTLDSAGKNDKNLLEIALSYVDTVSTKFQMSPKEVQTSKKKRTMIDKKKNRIKLEEERQKQAEKKREEKAAERDRKYAQLKTYEEKQKFEEAEEKQKKKKRLKKMRGKMKRK